MHRIYDKSVAKQHRIRVLRGAGQPARVAGTRICGAGAGNRTAICVRVELAAGRERVDKFFVQVLNVEPKHIRLNQLKNRKTSGCTQAVCQYCA